MEVCQGHFLTLIQGHLNIKIKIMVFSEIAWPIKLKFYVEPPWVVAFKLYTQYLGHMTKMAATPIYGKNPSKIFSRSGGLISTKLGFVASRTLAHHSLLK